MPELPDLSALAGARVTGFRRIGKRIVVAFEGGLFLVVHLMIAGRFQWQPAYPKVNRRLMLALFEFPRGTLVLTGAGTRKRASIHVVRGEAALAQFARGGIGNAYSDEILHKAKLSPLLLTSRMTDADIAMLFRATRESLAEWTERLRAALGDTFPAKVTAFREGMAVHGRFGKPCPVCRAPVQRIRYADNETNYCARCQTGGRRLADRAMSKLLKEDWPRTIEEAEGR